MKSALVKSHVFDITPEHKGLQTVAGVYATPEQECNLFSFRGIGEENVRAYM